MPEFPDITVYIEALETRIVGQQIDDLRIQAPFLLRTVEPPIDRFTNAVVCRIERMGKRIVFAVGDTQKCPDRWIVLHLMIAGRLHWKPAKQKPPGKSALMVMTFADGFLYLTEAGSKRRASLHLFDDPQAMAAANPGGLEVLENNFESFRTAFTHNNHTLKRALTDPHILSGIGNAYSDEILHRAGLSPIAMTQKLSEDELQRLHQGICDSLLDWTQRLRAHYGDGFPEKVTAFRPDMAVHGKYGHPCPVCETPVQRIRYAKNETNYCPRCQTDGRVLADRALSRLLKKDWPRTVEELEKKRGV
ncbi:MAG: DNA-formamidopyrimidine glycosylase family protein [Pseudomonadota bacterium]